MSGPATTETSPANFTVTPRSGSTLLCDLLTDTGVAGQPNSFFRRESFVEWAQYFGINCSGWEQPHLFDAHYLSAVIRYGSNDTGVFGLRLMWESLDALSARLGDLFPDTESDCERLATAFSTPRYLHLVREDKVAQAISHLKAEALGLWHAHPDGSERERLSAEQPLRYNRTEISQMVARHEADDASWGQWFESQNINPMRITYESLAQNPVSVVADVLQALGAEPHYAIGLKPRTARLADARSKRWYERFHSITK